MKITPTFQSEYLVHGTENQGGSLTYNYSAEIRRKVTFNQVTPNLIRKINVQKHYLLGLKCNAQQNSA